METAIIVALIGAAAVVIAAIIGRLPRRAETAASGSIGPAGLRTEHVPGHGLDVYAHKGWPPTPRVMATRAEYADRVWEETDVARIQEILADFWSAEQRAWVADGKHPWNDAAETAFRLDVSRVTNPSMAIQVIKNVQNNKY